MPARRALVSMEFLSQDGIRLILDDDGWRLVNPRQHGARQLDRARKLLERCAETTEPAQSQPGADAPDPPTMEEAGEAAAARLQLRVTQRRWRQQH